MSEILVSPEDVDRLLGEVLAVFRKNHEYDDDMGPWARSIGLSEEAFAHILDNTSKLMMGGLTELIHKVATEDLTTKQLMAEVLEYYSHLRSGAALSFILGLELQKQLLGGNHEEGRPS